MARSIRIPFLADSTEEAGRRCMFVPPTVVRQATASASTIAGDLKHGALVLCQLDKMREKSPDAEVVFMAGTWAECPALVPALYRAVWEGAIAARKSEKRT